jgi:hypothetical protein
MREPIRFDYSEVELVAAASDAPVFVETMMHKEKISE